MLDESIYEVTRADYASFVEQIKPEFRDVKEMEIGDRHTATKIYSKKTGKCLCSRVTHNGKIGDPEPEKYYIFEMPNDEERQPPIPKLHLNLETREEIQAFFSAIAKLIKEKKND